MLVRESSLFITTCHSILKEDNISTVLCETSGFSWSCSICTLQEVSLFFWEGERRMSLKEKWGSAMPPEVCAWRNTSGHCSRKALDCSQTWSHELSAVWMENLQGHHQVLMGVVLLLHQTAYSRWVSLARVPEQDKVWDTLLLELLTALHSPSSWVGVYLWSWNFSLIVKEWQDCQIVPST